MISFESRKHSNENTLYILVYQKDNEIYLSINPLLYKLVTMQEITQQKFKHLVLFGIYFIDLYDNLEHKTYPNKSNISSVVTLEELFHDAINIMISLHNTCNILSSCFSLAIYDFQTSYR